MPKSLVFIGDSLTEYFDWQYRFPEYRSVNLGIAGETVGELRERLDGTAPHMRSADVIFVMTGINNIASGDYSIVFPYESVISALTGRFPKARVVVQSILPVALHPEMNERIRSVNAQLQQAAEKHHAVYLDVFSAFVDTRGNATRDLLLDDGVHLSDKGYEVWAEVIERFLGRCRNAFG